MASKGNLSRKRRRNRHADFRAYERYGFNKDDVKAISQSIRAGKSKSMGGSNNKKKHKVTYKGQDVYVVYSKTTSQIVTFLTPERMRNRREE